MQDAARIGAVQKTEVDENKNNIVTSETRPNYTQDAPLYTPSGIDAPPLEKDRVILVRVEGTGKFAIIGYLGATQGANPGELFLYSRDKDGNTQAILKLKNDGGVECIAPEAISINTEKDYTLKAKGAMNVNTEKDYALEVTNAAKIKANTMELNSTNTVLTGGNVQCNGIVTPNASGAFCGIPVCPFTGAPQTGNIAANA